MILFRNLRESKREAREVALGGSQSFRGSPGANAGSILVYRRRIGLLGRRTRAIDVLTVGTLQEETKMTDVEELEQTATPAETGQGQKPERKASTAPEKPRSASSRGQSGKKTTHAKKDARAPKGTKTLKAVQRRGAAREGSKSANVLDLLKRPDGATIKEIMKVIGWQAHSVRGFISGTLGKKLGLSVKIRETRGR
jgi:hypothetical protein